MFALDGPIYSFMKKISDLVILNLCWLLFCLPVFTIGASFAAFFAISFDRKRGIDNPIFITYFKYFKKYFARGTLLMLVILFSLAIIVSNFIYWNYIVQGFFADVMGIVALALCVPVGLLFIYGFAGIAVFECGIKLYIKKVFYIAYKYPMQSIKMMLVWVFIVIFNMLNLYSNLLFLLIGFAPIVHVFISQGLFLTYEKES